MSWPKSLVRKWFNVRTTNKQQAHAQAAGRDGGEGIDQREAEAAGTPNKCRARNDDLDVVSRMTDIQHYRIFASTWNVGGKSPSRGLDLDNWLLHSSPPASDIYVLGFQEIVALNAGNVLGTEDSVPAKKWVSLIRRTLNKNNPAGPPSSHHSPSPVLLPDHHPVVELDDADSQGGNDMFSVRPESNDFDGNIYPPSPDDEDEYSYMDEDHARRSNIVACFSPFLKGYGRSMEEQTDSSSRYCLVASKQMVGIFLTVWVRTEIRSDVRDLQVSCVGRGLMGYLGNKGSISISMSLHHTTVCFICSHLTSGEKEGDELRRNSDVMEILKKTRFPRPGGPKTILEHDRIIWLGDLNYRISLSYSSAKALVEMHNWKQLLEKDQLQIERRRGHVFEGWKEGRIYFPPTYKYSSNSDRYSGYGMRPKEKRPTPAWCDRILWYGSGLIQLSYVRGESRFSAHRPVYSIFVAEVDILPQRRSYLSSRVEVEELLPYCGEIN